jgi:hypothetical protein
MGKLNSQREQPHRGHRHGVEGLRLLRVHGHAHAPRLRVHAERRLQEMVHVLGHFHVHAVGLRALPGVTRLATWVPSTVGYMGAINWLHGCHQLLATWVPSTVGYMGAINCWLHGCHQLATWVPSTGYMGVIHALPGVINWCFDCRIPWWKSGIQPYEARVDVREHDVVQAPLEGEHVGGVPLHALERARHLRLQLDPPRRAFVLPRRGHLAVRAPLRSGTRCIRRHSF